MAIMQVTAEEALYERMVDYERAARPSPQRLAAFFKSIGLDKDHVKPNDVLLSLLLIVGCENWNHQPPDTDTIVGETPETEFGLTKLPLWSRAATDPKAAPGYYSKAAGSYDTRDLPGDASTDRFEVPPVKISWEGADLAHPGRRRD